MAKVQFSIDGERVDIEALKQSRPQFVILNAAMGVSRFCRVLVRLRTLPCISLTWGLLLFAGSAQGEDAPLPITGDKTPGLESFDRAFTDLLKTWKVPGAAVAVMHEGRLVMARGYGWSDVGNNEPVEPQALFRLASISKPITAVAILRLIEQRQISLDDRIFARLEKLLLPDGATLPENFDERWRQVTVRQLLQHTGGWDRDQSFDPMFRPDEFAKQLGTQPPADPLTVCRAMLAYPLDFDPGTKYAYSNFGYCLLGRLIEVVTGKTYEAAVKELVFDPAGMRQMRLGRSLLADRQPDEVRYYPTPRDATEESVFPNGGEVPIPYGGFYLEAMDAHGGWLGTAGDLLKMVAAIDGFRGPRLLKPESVEQMLARPPAPMPPDSDTWYGLGWSVRPFKNDVNWWHNGALSGTSTVLVRTGDKRAWVALLNAWPKNRRGKSIHQQLDATLWKAADEVKEWPRHDLFDDPPKD